MHIFNIFSFSLSRHDICKLGLGKKFTTKLFKSCQPECDYKTSRLFFAQRTFDVPLWIPVPNHIPKTHPKGISILFNICAMMLTSLIIHRLIFIFLWSPKQNEERILNFQQHGLYQLYISFVLLTLYSWKK